MTDPSDHDDASTPADDPATEYVSSGQRALPAPNVQKDPASQAVHTPSFR